MKTETNYVRIDMHDVTRIKKNVKKVERKNQLATNDCTGHPDDSVSIILSRVSSCDSKRNTMTEEKESNLINGDVTDQFEDSISIINIDTVSCIEESDANIEKNENVSILKNAFKTLSFSLVIIGTALAIILPWTSIPRTNSIIYQSHWMEVVLPFINSD